MLAAPLYIGGGKHFEMSLEGINVESSPMAKDLYWRITILQVRGNHMVQAPPRPSPRPPAQRTLVSKPKGDYRLLIPGWGGELAPEESDYIQDQLFRDDQLAFSWGFQPRKKRRAEWSIRAVALWGDSDRRSTNMALARQRSPETLVVGA